MTVAVHTRATTKPEFLASAAGEPILMSRPSLPHARIAKQFICALERRPDPAQFDVLGPSGGIATIDEAVRFPDVVVTRGRAPDTVQEVDDSALAELAHRFGSVAAVRDWEAKRRRPERAPEAVLDALRAE